MVEAVYVIYYELYITLFDNSLSIPQRRSKFDKASISLSSECKTNFYLFYIIYVIKQCKHN